MLKEIIAAIIFFAAAPSFASEWQVQMLNYGEQRGMLFQAQFIHAQLGDSVTFVGLTVDLMDNSTCCQKVINNGNQRLISLYNKSYWHSLVAH